jgi:hypothetical protein
MTTAQAFRRHKLPAERAARLLAESANIRESMSSAKICQLGNMEQNIIVKGDL